MFKRYIAIGIIVLLLSVPLALMLGRSPGMMLVAAVLTETILGAFLWVMWRVGVSP